MTTVLIIAAHPDDEILGCSATIACHTSLGDDVNILIVAEGAASLDTSLSGGSSVSFRPEGLPDFALSFDFDGNDSSMSDYTSSDRNAGFNAALDFSKFLPRADSQTEPYLKLTYYGENSMFRDSDSGASTDLGQAVSLTMGLNF